MAGRESGKSAAARIALMALAAGCCAALAVVAAGRGELPLLAAEDQVPVSMPAPAGPSPCLAAVGEVAATTPRREVPVDPRPAAWLLEDEADPAGPERPVRAGSERAHRLGFAVRLQRDLHALDAEIDDVFADGPDGRRVALLRALWSAGAPAAGPAFIRAAHTPQDVATAPGLGLPSFAIGFLARRAATEARARDVLAQIDRNNAAGPVVLRAGPGARGDDP